ncbi:biotin transport system substrate-specific component [Cohaesibacter sp. ES.047]|uniref:biotin transporter BioY n=1 Tax=Cohaesibacter sp. ES.047 TaxID=1798205 RepID=UPI000BB8E116|nr:biotin transporter BioY [Cohaesibacter sp. ES.047]SNY92656.1 biotin transport system substrate-specific component [Cohaesibacter sp. ES.047]
MERQIAYIALFAALIAALGLLPPIPTPTGVPITAQTLGVMLAGTILGAKRGALASLLLVIIVLMGLPLLSGGRGGLGLLQGPTVGFLLGWPIASYFSGLIVGTWRKGNLFLVASVASIIGGIVVLYLCGVVGLIINTKLSVMEATMGSIIYVPGDIIKAIVAGFLTQAIAKARPNALLSR